MNDQSRPILQADLLATARDVRGTNEFKEWTKREVRRVIPHGALACGLGRIHAAGVALDYIVVVDYPVAHLETIRNKAGGIDTPILRRWMTTEKPQLFESVEPWPDCPANWLENFNKHGLTNALAHAVYDTERCIGTYFSFHRIPGRLNSDHCRLACEVVPVMHEVMCRVIAALDDDGGFTARIASLTPREKELIEWLRLGKTNSEIGQIVNLSETTIKHHLTSIFLKLGIENRVQLVRRLMEASTRPAQGYGTKII